jgi:hypothetical protein
MDLRPSKTLAKLYKYPPQDQKKELKEKGGRGKTY